MEQIDERAATCAIGTKRGRAAKQIVGVELRTRNVRCRQSVSRKQHKQKTVQNYTFFCRFVRCRVVTRVCVCFSFLFRSLNLARVGASSA